MNPSMMDIDRPNGYGYSVWFVPNNYKDIQEHYNITHIPHITLETNLSLKDAFHIYHNNTNKKILVKFKENFVKFPSFYPHDPLMYFGWYVEVLRMSGRKLNWSPHMSVRYLPRTNTSQSVGSFQPPPMGPVECFMTIADTRSGVPTEWHIDDTYFNIKASQSLSLSFDEGSKHSRSLKSNIDEYIGTNLSRLHTLPSIIKERMLSCGIVISDNDLRGVVAEIRNELTKVTAMDVDVRNI